ncbi:hypothetical protein AeMF1_017844 [Aphanomyces euteiches]|nr:hypothetical protein AeMF1_017844 [Aphanomyces euteiches]
MSAPTEEFTKATVGVLSISTFTIGQKVKLPKVDAANSETHYWRAQPEALDTADAQPRAEDPEVGAQAPVEVAEDVDVHAQEVADAQATPM